MTLILRGATIADVSSKALQALTVAGNARHITIDPVRHRIEFKREARAGSKVIIHTQTMFTGAEIVDLVTVPLADDVALRETTGKKFLDFIAACSADRVIWECPLIKL